MLNSEEDGCGSRRFNKASTRIDPRHVYKFKTANDKARVIESIKDIPIKDFENIFNDNLIKPYELKKTKIQ